MTEVEAINRFESFGLEVESLLPSFRPNGYLLTDQHRPDANGASARCTLMTYFWKEGEEWVWESKLVVPGPGPRRRFRLLSELVEAVLVEYEASRRTS